MSELAIAVEALRRATTKQDAEAARCELAAALHADEGYKRLVQCWAKRLRFVQHFLAEFDLHEAEAEAFLFLSETPQLQLPALGVSLIRHRWRDTMRHLNRWLVHQFSAVQYGTHASRRFERRVWKAFSVALDFTASGSEQVQSYADRPRVTPAPMGCDGCDGSLTDARGRCRRCQLRRRA